MNKDLIRSGVKILNKLYFHPEKRDEWLAIASTELMLELGLFKNAQIMANLIYSEESYGLLEKIKLFDMKLAHNIEQILKGE
ncbi:hypothetical protein [Neobacillus mesonae]|uniref:Uncharacterized protein n=1 Tax=Neobacillus mesonae TaxID=1193713 RepID=A0A3T0HST9_9BACI|nr:hypothetical protein [Neobacillus mesonae]AZU60107.1 hypothetical protein CHR53_01840 [Neobacillus mesonae]